MFSIGDLVIQRGLGVAIISDILKEQLHLGLIGIVVEVIVGKNHSYDGRSRDDLRVQWSNGDVETLPEIYLEKL
tara:strand:+ start:6438 stop:6659 length:222 start_codon:yes stop_codon:yes gene_type:complete